MRIIERLQRLDERLGLDSPHKQREREERRAALEALPDAVRRSLTHRRLVAMALTIGALLLVGVLGLGLLLPLGHDGWVVASIVLTFIATLVGVRVGQRIEEQVLAAHCDEDTRGR